MNLEAALRAEGVQVVAPDGWEQRTAAGTFTPVGVMSHHTASAPSAKTPVPSLKNVINGFPPRPPTYPRALPGPLCNVLIGRDAKAYLVSNRRGNDSGTGVQRVLDRVRSDEAPAGNATAAGDVNGNPWFYDIEVENNGVGEPWAPAVVATLVKVNTAICRHHGWSANRCIGHREWTRRKPDPAGLDMTQLRASVRWALAPRTEDPLMAAFRDDGEVFAIMTMLAYDAYLGRKPSLQEIATQSDGMRKNGILATVNAIAGSDEAQKYAARRAKAGL